MPQVTASTCDRYDISGEHGDWAIVLIGERDGLLSIVSDFGNWAYCWPRHGCKSIKRFLVDICQGDYLVGKLGAGARQFDFAASVRQLRRVLGKHYRDRTLFNSGDSLVEFDKAKCVEALDAVSGLEATDSADVFCLQLNDASEFAVLDWYYEDIIVMRDDPGLCSFLSRLWPSLVERLKSEIGCDSPEQAATTEQVAPQSSNSHTC